jgi:hypothetical protein
MIAFGLAVTLTGPATTVAQPTVAHVVLTASDAAPGDAFGRSVAISGDSIIVGAPGDDERGENAGAAYVFVRDASGAWIERQKLLPYEAIAGDFFGWSVDLDGDVIVVGAPGDRRDLNGVPLSPNTSRGAAYVFVLVNGSWVQQTRLQPRSLVPGAYFGWRVAVSGVQLLVSAPWHRIDGAPGSSIYYPIWPYSRTASGWTTKGPVNGWRNEGMALALDGAVAVSGSPTGTRRYLNPAGDWIPTGLYQWPWGTPDGVAEGAAIGTPFCLERHGSSLLLCEDGYQLGKRLRRVDADARVTTLQPMPADSVELAVDDGDALWVTTGSQLGILRQDGTMQEVLQYAWLRGIEGGPGDSTYGLRDCELVQVTAAGAVTTVTGRGYECNRVDGPLADARLASPVGLARSPGARWLYVAETSAIRRVDFAAGMVTTIAGGSGSFDCQHVDGVGTAARFCSIQAVSPDSSDGLLVNDRGALRRMTSDGRVETLRPG